MLYLICDDKRFKMREDNGVNPSYLIFFCKINRHFEEINGNRYQTLVSTNERKEKIIDIKSCGLKSEIKLDQKLR